MKYKKGDTVKVKSLEDIRATFEHYNEYCKHTNINFNKKMEPMCGGTYKVIDIIMEHRILLNTLKVVPTRNWVWSEHWLESPFEVSKLPEDLFEL